MPNQSSHPSKEELNAYSLGQLPENVAIIIDGHVSECVPCCETIAGLSSDDTFVGQLQNARQVATEKTVPDHGATTEVDPSVPEIPAPLLQHARYEILGLIGRGGMGDVFKARHRMMNRTVAIKVIKRQLVRRSEAVDRFHREVETAARLSHPNIVTAFDAEQAEDVHYLVMEQVDGVNLSQTVDERGALAVSDACDYIRQAAAGLQYAHEQGMVHRDIKPHNLMVTEDGTVKILDFGLASLAPQPTPEEPLGEDADGNLTIAGAIMGTPDFISPEQAQDAHNVDGRSDIYSLGMTLYFLLAGRVPFAEGCATDKLKLHTEAHPPRLEKFRSDVPAGVQEIFDRMTAKDPAERFQSPQEVVDALRDCFGEPPVPEARPSFGASGRSRWWLVVGLLLIGSLGLFAYQNPHLFSWRVTTESDVYAPVSELESYVAAMAASPHRLVYMNVYELGPDDVSLGFKALQDGLIMDIDVSSTSRGNRSRGKYANRMKEIAAALAVPVKEEATISKDGAVSSVQFVFNLSGDPSTIAANAQKLVTDGLALHEDTNALFQCRNFPDHLVRSDNYSARQVGSEEFVGEYQTGNRVFLGEIAQQIFLVPEERKDELPMKMDEDVWYTDVRELPPGFAAEVRRQAADKWYLGRVSDQAVQQNSKQSGASQPELKLTHKTEAGGTGGLPKVHNWNFSGRDIGDWKVQLWLAQNGKANIVQEFDFEELPTEFTSQVRLEVRDPADAKHNRNVNAMLYVESPTDSRCKTTNEDKGLSITLEAPFSAGREQADLRQVKAKQSQLLYAQGYWKGDMSHGTSMESMTEATTDRTAVFLFVTLEWSPVGAPTDSEPVVSDDQLNVADALANADVHDFSGT